MIFFGVGYASEFELLLDMPDVVHYEFSATHNDYCLYGIADNSCYLPSWLRKSQGLLIDFVLPVLTIFPVSTGKNLPSTPPPLLKSPPKPALSSAKANSGHKKSYSKRGLVAIHVSFKRGNTKHDDSSSTITMMVRR